MSTDALAQHMKRTYSLKSLMLQALYEDLHRQSQQYLSEALDVAPHASMRTCVPLKLTRLRAAVPGLIAAADRGEPHDIKLYRGDAPFADTEINGGLVAWNFGGQRWYVLLGITRAYSDISEAVQIIGRELRRELFLLTLYRGVTDKDQGLAGDWIRFAAGWERPSP